MFSNLLFKTELDKVENYYHDRTCFWGLFRNADQNSLTLFVVKLLVTFANLNSRRYSKQKLVFPTVPS